MIGTGYPKTNARAMNQSVLPMALGSSGSARTRRKFSRPTNVGLGHEVGLLDAHDEAAQDREPGEHAEHEQERQQEDERARGPRG